MPKRLPDRWRPESIQEFRASARQRFDDGLTLAAGDCRAGAIYLWGYCAEMLLKAAYFSVIGIHETTALDWKTHILAAMQKGQTVFHIPWPPKAQGHNVPAWAELLVAERAALAKPHPVVFGLEVQRQAQRVRQLWSETLRYHNNFPYPHEVRQVREAAEWFLVNSDVL
jgi:hypothetical protein